MDPSKPATGYTIKLGDDKDGTANNAMKMDNSVETCQIPPETMNGLVDFTVTLWVNFQEFKSPSAIFSVANSGSDNTILIFHNKIYFQKSVRPPAANEKCDFGTLNTVN